MTTHAPESSHSSWRTVLGDVSKVAAIIIFLVGAGAGFVINAERSQVTADLKLKALEGEIATLKIEDTRLRAEMVTQAQFSEVIKRLDQNISRIDTNVQLLVEDLTGRVTVRHYNTKAQNKP